MLQLARADGGFAIEAEAVQHAQQQIRHQRLKRALSMRRPLQASCATRTFIVEHDVGARREHRRGAESASGRGCWRRSFAAAGLSV